MFRNAMPSLSELDDLYEKSWSAPESNRNETGGTSNRYAEIYANRLARSIKRPNLKGLKILEFGAGTMVETMQALGAEVVAVEPYGHKVIADKGFEVYQSLEDLPGDLQFDGALSIDVVEHLLAPWKEITQMAKFLKPNGWLMTSTLNAEGLNARMTQDKWREVVKEVHTYFYNPKSLEELLKSCGLTKVKRLQWFVPYSKSSLRNLLHYTIAMLRLEGELRYLAYKL